MKKFISFALAMAMVLGIIGVIPVSAAEEFEYNVSDAEYYRGNCTGSKAEMHAPDTVKVTTAEELKNQWNDDLGCDESFFESNFLLFVNWVEPCLGLFHKVSAVNAAETEVDIELTEIPQEKWFDYADVVTPHCAVLKLPKSLADKDFIVTEHELTRIYTAEQLKDFADSVNSGNTYENAYVELLADIDLSGICGADIDGEEVSWEPIGNTLSDKSSGHISVTTIPFKGSFEGNGYEVKNLYINNSDDFIDGGLFGRVENAVVKNLTVSGDITGKSYAGGIVGFAGKNSVISGCINKTNISVLHDAGGIAGHSGKGTLLISCENEGGITAATGYAGGITGESGGRIEYCKNSGSVLGENNTGGIAGHITGCQNVEEGIILNCFNTGDVTDKTDDGAVGGIVGGNHCGEVINCFNAGIVSGGYYTGTIAGTMESDEDVDVIVQREYSYIKNCYYLSGNDINAAGELWNDGCKEEAYEKSAEEFASGEVTYLLNGSASDGKLAWYQTIGEDEYPALDSAHLAVYFDGENYSNTMPYDPTKKIIVDPPTVNIKSGAVPYGTKITVNPSNALVAYSINGGEFVYSYFAPTITITEDTTLTVKSWVDYLDPNTEYICTEAVYKYTIDNTPEYLYSITGLRILNEAGKEISVPEEGKSFIVEADITEIKERNEKDYLFTAVYDAEGALISLDYVRSDFITDKEASFGFYVPAQEAAAESVRVFIWNGFGAAEPLAQSKELSFTKSEEPLPTPRPFHDNTRYLGRLMSYLPDNENYVVSPLSLKMAMMMVANGAEGNTKNEILNAFDVSDLDEYNNMAKLIIDNFKEDSTGASVNIANAIWFNKDFYPENENADFSDEYKSRLADYYSAESRAVNNDNMIASINGWIEERTNGMFKNIANETNVIPQNTLLSLTNTVYMKARWVNEFYKGATKPDIFTDINGNEKSIDFMSQQDHFGYFENDTTKMISLPYQNHLSMYIVLGDTDNIEENMHNMEQRLVNVSIPKFKTDYSVDLNEVLLKMGVVKAFEANNTDFSSMLVNTPDFMNVNSVFQNAVIDVDEKGTEAAAVTYVGYAGASEPEPEEVFEFKADKPFTYFIKDYSSDEILFAGQYVK